MDKGFLDEIDLSQAPEFDQAPVDIYHDVEPHEEDFEVVLFDSSIGEDDINYNVDVSSSLKEAEAVKDSGEKRQPIKKHTSNAPRQLEELEQFVSLPDSVKSTIIGKYAQKIAELLEFPEASTFMSLLGCASASVACNYAVQYKTKSSISTGLYVIVEQPPSTQKTRILGAGLNTYKKAMAKHNAKVFGKLREAKEGDPDLYSWLRPGFVDTTDATTAAIDKCLATCSEGRYVIASAEQSALIALFPSANAYTSTNELILKGYAGEHVSGMRSGRQAFTGIANGTIALIAQSGSASRILRESDGTGMAERFFFVAEPDYLGFRMFNDDVELQSEKHSFDLASLACVQAYSNKIHSYSQSNEDSRVILDPDNLEQLRATLNGYTAIRDYRRSMEPRLKELKESGDMVMLSWLGKFEAHVLKIASVMHVFECLGNESKVSDVIPDRMVFAAMDLVEVMSAHQEQLIRDNGDSGVEAEEQAVIDVLSNKPMPRTAALQKLRFKNPFRKMLKNASRNAGKRVDAMIQAGKVMVNSSGKLEVI